MGYNHVVFKSGVHRVVAAAFLGPRPDGHVINHKNGDKADNRAENLEYLTPSDNAIHAYRTGLQQRGEKHGRAKLTDENVAEIRERYTGGWGQQAQLAREYGVSQGLISQIVRGEIWTHLETGAVQRSHRKFRRGERHHNATVSNKTVRAIRDRYAAGGVTHQELAGEYGISRTTVSRIVRRSIWKHVT